MNYPHKLLIYLILLTSSLSSITSAYCSTLDSLSILSEIPGADMTVYSLYIENKEKDKEKAADCAELFMSGIDSSAHNIYLAGICDYIARWYETDKFLFSKAVSWRLRSLEMYTALNDTYHKALTEHCLAILYFQKGQYHLALRYTDDALDILKTSGTAHDVMNCYMLLGAIYRICGDTPKANEYYTSYVNTAKKINDSLSVAKGMNNIASISTAPSDTAKRVRLMLEAIELSENTAGGQDLCRMYLNAAIAYMDAHSYKESEKYIELARPLAVNIFLKGLWNYVNGMLHGELGETALAIEDLNTAINYYSQGEFEKETAGIYGMLSDLYQSIGDSALAFESLRNRDYYDSRSDSRNIMLELFKAQNENLIIEKDRQLEQSRDKVRIIILASVLSTVIILLVVILIIKRQSHEIELREITVQNRQKLMEERKMYWFRLNSIISKAIGELSGICRDMKPGKTRDRIMEVCTELGESENGEIIKEMRSYVPEPEDGFYKNLTREFPTLTVNESRLCVLLNKNLSTKQISGITRQSPESINLARARLRKKLGITGKDISIQEFLRQFNP